MFCKDSLGGVYPISLVIIYKFYEIRSHFTRMFSSMASAVPQICKHRRCTAVGSESIGEPSATIFSPTSCQLHPMQSGKNFKNRKLFENRPDFRRLPFDNRSTPILYFSTTSSSIRGALPVRISSTSDAIFVVYVEETFVDFFEEKIRKFPDQRISFPLGAWDSQSTTSKVAARRHQAVPFNHGSSRRPTTPTLPSGASRSPPTDARHKGPSSSLSGLFHFLPVRNNFRSICTSEDYPQYTPHSPSPSPSSFNSRFRRHASTSRASAHSIG